MILIHGSNSVGSGGGGSAVIGGRTYRTANIGGFEWLAENLDYKFDGLEIAATFKNTPVGCYYNNDEQNYGLDGTYKCGLLYNWYAVDYLNTNRATLCPGWHVPTIAEWSQLITDAGSIAAKNLKALDSSILSNWPSGWGGVDAFGMSILPAGYFGGYFDGFGSNANFWTDTPYGTSNAYRTRAEYNSDIFSSGYNYGREGCYSLRLIKDY